LHLFCFILFHTFISCIEFGFWLWGPSLHVLWRRVPASLCWYQILYATILVLVGDWYRITCFVWYQILFATILVLSGSCSYCARWWHLQGEYNSFKLEFQSSDTTLEKEVREMLPVVVFKESFLIRENS
jgi:hypothetical protein